MAQRGFGLLLFVLTLSSNDPESRALEVKTAQTTTSAAAAACSTSRRTFGVSSLVAAATTLLSPFVPAASCLADGDGFNFEARDRKGNKEAVIRDDYWYIFGRTPPRQLRAPLVGSDPQWNTFGSCESSESSGTNSCTYVSLNQRIPAYTKYASSIAYGAKEYQRLGAILQNIKVATTSTAASSSSDSDSSTAVATLWDEAASYLQKEAGASPAAAVDAELKMVLFATAMLTSPNFPGPSRELLVARFYANELRYANQACYEAIRARDATRALAAWEFGRDSWNSFYQTIDRQIVPKVGDKFVPI